MLRPLWLPVTSAGLLETPCFGETDGNSSIKAAGHCAKSVLLACFYSITSGAGSVKSNEHLISIKKELIC